MNHPPRIGLTGGIGSGKSLVARRFSELGIPVLDADQITRSLCAPGQPALAEIQAEFGATVIQPDGNLNRQMMREIIFRDITARRILEKILHPRVRLEMVRQAEQIQSPYIVFVIPLLIESAQRDLVDRILVIDCPEEIQIERVQKRDGLSRTAVATIIATQATREIRRAAANDILMNDTDRNTLYTQIDILDVKYRNLNNY